MQLFRAQALNALSVSSIALLLGAGAACLAQTASPAAPGTPASPDSITIDARVTDKLGHHLSGLQAQDFTLLDNKLPVKVVDFHEIDGRSNAEPVRVLIVIDAINTGF